MWLAEHQSDDLAIQSTIVQLDMSFSVIATLDVLCPLLDTVKMF